MQNSFSNSLSEGYSYIGSNRLSWDRFAVFCQLLLVGVKPQFVNIVAVYNWDRLPLSQIGCLRFLTFHEKFVSDCSSTSPATCSCKHRNENKNGYRRFFASVSPLVLRPSINSSAIRAACQGFDTMSDRQSANSDTLNVFLNVRFLIFMENRGASPILTVAVRNFAPSGADAFGSSGLILNQSICGKICA